MDREEIQVRILRNPLKQAQKFQSSESRENVMETKDGSMKWEWSTVFNVLHRLFKNYKSISWT